MKSVEQCLQILGVTRDATPEQIRLAYRDLVRSWHPDHFAHNQRLQQKAEEKLKEINEAYAQIQSTFLYAESRQTQPTSDTATSQPTQTTVSRTIRRSSVSKNSRSATPPRPQSKKTKPDIFSWFQRGRRRAAMLLIIPVAALTVWLFKPASLPEQGKRLNAAQLKAREDIFNTLKETRAGAERLLLLHQSEVDRLSRLYEERRTQHAQGEFSKAELLQVEQALSEARLRVSEDQKWLAETDLALKEFTGGQPAVPR